VFAAIFMLYMGITGSAIQTIDLRTLLSRAPATDPNIQSIHEGVSGPANFQVIADADYAAPPLPPSLDLSAALNRVLTSLRTVAPAAPLAFLEFRMEHGVPIGQVKSEGRLLRFDAVSGTALSESELIATPTPTGQIKSQHNAVKAVHRMTAYGPWATVITVVVGLALCTFLVTGMWLYLRLFAARARLGRQGVFWLAGGWWRSLHRCIAVAASAWVLVVAVSGTWLTVEGLGIAIYVFTHNGQRIGVRVDASSPLQDLQLPSQLKTTLEAHAEAMAAVPIKVLRLRYFAGMPQGVIISGAGDSEAQQSVYNSATGRVAREWEPGYPPTGYLFGWQVHENVKRIHRGDYFGLTGRWLDLLTGLSIVFLALSGVVMYFNLWNQRRRSGRRSLVWS
jgi:uncharacterized iron-regulated membrane protein